ncbi:MAG TPA: ATP-binding protein, partial [Vicinamibacterales bacterium]|nr:ATP-binding protein [Vicinamibacterales bacterium]
MNLSFDRGGEVGALMKQLDWTRTPLGAPDTWPQSLRAVVRIMLTSRYPMWIGWGPALTFLYNDPYARILGTKHPSALGQSAPDVWREIWDEVGPRIERVLTTGEATYDEALLLMMERHGYLEETYFTFSYSPIFDEQSRISGNFCVVMEDTEKIIGERRLALLRDLAARLAESTTERDVLDAIQASLAGEPRDLPFSLVYLLDGEASHPRLACATGVDERTAAGYALDVLAQNGTTVTCPKGNALLLRLQQQGQAAPAGVFVAGLNPYRPVDDAYRTFLNLFAGQVSSGLANAHAHEGERRRAEMLAALDRAKTAFFSNISHEFRTPLTLMLGPTEDALAAGGTIARDQLELIHRNELRLLKLVNSLLDFSRTEAGRTQALYEPTDLSAITIDLASTFRSAIERGGLTFEVDCEPLEQPVFVDRQMWEKVVLNLLSNAFKFTLSGGIRVTLHSEGEAAVLTVTDTGVGIPGEELPRLFERFHRIEGMAARTPEGSGIGLALVQDLVRLHGGSIAASSEVGRGTTFRVRVPYGTANLPADRIGRSADQAPANDSWRMFVSEAERWLGAPDGGAVDFTALDPALATGGGSTRTRIVLADDNADMRAYLARLLGASWSVEAVANGREALGAVARQRADLVLADVMMPEMDGFELIRRLREDEATRDIPIVLLSARAGEEARVEGLQAGADDYVVKPFSARELTARIETQLLRASIRAADSLRRRQLADIFRQAPAAIAILRGPEHVYEHANPAYLALTGNRPVVGLPFRDARPELAGQGIYELLDVVYATGDPHVGKALPLMVVRDSAALEERFFDFVYEATRDATGLIDGIAVVAFDVTDLVRARREAELANRAKDEFLAMLGHELRNPLAPMRTALQLMRLRGGNALERERTVIERQTQHLVRLVDDLLDVSRIARGKIDLRREHIDVADAVAKAIEMASPMLEERQHDLTIDVPRGLELDADPARLAQVIANLLTNAAKYTESGGRVSISATREPGWVVISVRDSGIGISSEMLPRVFEMFAQERQALDRTQGGLGLGLTIVRNLVKLHGGTVYAKSQGRGKGSEFIVKLPAVSVAVTATSAAPAPDTMRRSAAPGARVLIVDDNVDAAEMFSDFVQSLGYEVRTVHDGPAALRVVEEFAPTVALLDIGLPVMDGYELAARLPAAAPTHVKLIAVTGYGQEADRNRAKNAGF